MTDLSTAPASNSDSPRDHDPADATDVGETSAPTPAGPPDTASSVLDRLEQAGWRSLHGRTAPGTKVIDHIAIGPGGIFVIDSHVLDATGTDVHLASVPEAAIVAANHLADAVRQLVPPLTRQYVVPVLAYVASAPMSIARGPVQVCTTSMLQRVIASRTAALSDRDIEEVFAVLTAAFDGRGSVPAPAPAAPQRESHHAAPKRRKLGWRGAHHIDEPTDSAPTPSAPAGPWPAVTPPPVWEPAQLGPVVPPEPYVVPGPVAEPEAVDETADFEHLDAEPIAESVDVAEVAEVVEVVETDEPVDNVEPAEVVASDATVATPHADGPDDTDDTQLEDDGIGAVWQTAREPEPVSDEPADLPWAEPLADDSAGTLATDLEGWGDHVHADWIAAQPDVAAAQAETHDDGDGVDDEEPTFPAPARDPLIGSFPVGWSAAGEPVSDEHADDRYARIEDAVDVAEATDPTPFGVTPAAVSASPWPTIQLPDFSAADEPDLDIDSLAPTDIADEPDEPAEFDAVDSHEHQPVVEQAAATPSATVDPTLETTFEQTSDPTSRHASAPTPIGRTQPGGRRRAPTAPWHERLLPKTRTKSERPEGGRRAAPRPQLSGSERDSVAHTGGKSEPRPAGSRRATTARPRTLSARIGAVNRDKDARTQPTSRRPKRSRSHNVETGAPFGAAKAPAELSSRGQKMYAAMTARQAAGVEFNADEQPANVGAPIRRLITLGVAAGLLIVSGTHVTSISAWVADHVNPPGVGDTTGKNPKGGDGTPGRSANLEPPGSPAGGNGGKHAKP
jgi:hypothetical protein